MNDQVRELSESVQKLIDQTRELNDSVRELKTRLDKHERYCTATNDALAGSIVRLSAKPQPAAKANNDPIGRATVQLLTHENLRKGGAPPRPTLGDFIKTERANQQTQTP